MCHLMNVRNQTTDTLHVVIPTYARFDLLVPALESLLAQTVDDLAITVVDNASPEGIADRVRRQFPKVNTLRMSTNTFFSAAANAGAMGTRTRYLAVLNDDVVVNVDWAAAVIAALDHDPTIGSVASKVLQAAADGVISSAGDHLNVNGWAGNIGWGEADDGTYDTPVEVFSASGACAVYRWAALCNTGLFDPHFTAYLEDVDLGFRLQLQGQRCAYIPTAVAHHLGGATPKSRFKALYLTERNMVWNLLKNMPTDLLTRHAREILRAQGRPAPVVGGNDPRAWLLGKLGAISHMPTMLAKRRYHQANRKVSTAYIDSLLHSQTIDRCHL